MPARPIVLDANLLVLLIVGIASPTYIGIHKRLRAYSLQDFDLLTRLLETASRIIVTPNTLTEAVNLGRQIKEPARTRILQAFRSVVADTTEIYIASVQASRRNEFLRLGLTDAVVLGSAAAQDTIVTADLDLYLEAARQGRKVINFNHYREAYL